MFEQLRTAIAAAALASVAVSATAADTAESLSWLSGCWQHDGAERGSQEVWSEAAGGTLFGFSRSVRDGRTVAYEYLRIAAGEDGRLQFIASPSGQRTTAFTLVASDARSVSFENPEHDFPQRIAYRLLPGERLQATISGTIDGRERVVEFPMTRCVAPDA